MSKQPKTLAQNKRIFALGAKRGFAVDDLRELAEHEFGEPSLSSLDFGQANHLIRKLGGLPFPERMTSVPRRTLQDRQLKAGVPSIVSPTHIDHLRRLWREDPNRTEAGLESLTRKILGHPKPRTGAECNKVIEAVKSMNRRNKAAKEAA